jgi:hypothetical protein
MKVIQGLPKKARRGYTEYSYSEAAPLGNIADEMLFDMALANYNKCREGQPHWPEHPDLFVQSGADNTGLDRARWGWYIAVKDAG